MCTIESLNDAHRKWARAILREHWGSERVVSRGQMFEDAAVLPGFVAITQGQPVGLITFDIQRDECEIVTIISLREKIGIGTTLIEQVKHQAIVARCRRLWLITTNDNLPALRFYQKRGFVLVAVHPNALAKTRQIKPEVPLRGLDGIPLRDEIELEMRL